MGRGPVVEDTRCLPRGTSPCADSRHCRQGPFAVRVPARAASTYDAGAGRCRDPTPVDSGHLLGERRLLRVPLRPSATSRGAVRTVHTDLARPALHHSRDRPAAGMDHPADPAVRSGFRRAGHGTRGEHGGRSDRHADRRIPIEFQRGGRTSYGGSRPRSPTPLHPGLLPAVRPSDAGRPADGRGRGRRTPVPVPGVRAVRSTCHELPDRACRRAGDGRRGSGRSGPRLRREAA